MWRSILPAISITSQFLAIVLSVLSRYSESDYPFGIFILSYLLTAYPSVAPEINPVIFCGVRVVHLFSFSVLFYYVYWRT
jgi:hypothetical protein